MDRTGTSFEMNPKSFTLENMFAMELNKYANVIGDIVTSAVKELNIEKASILPVQVQGSRYLTLLFSDTQCTSLFCVCRE